MVGGHQTLAVLKHLGRHEAWVHYVDLELEAEMALNLALNNIKGPNDYEKLVGVLSRLEGSPFAAATGFSRDEVDALLADDRGRKLEAFPSVEIGRDELRNKCPRCGFEFS